MYQQAQRVHLSATSKAIAAAHDALLNTALDSVRWVRRGLSTSTTCRATDSRRSSRKGRSERLHWNGPTWR